jgi:hypothetical protein
VLVGVDAVNVTAAYQPVVQACGSTARLHSRLICASVGTIKNVFDTIAAWCKHEEC